MKRAGFLTRWLPILLLVPQLLISGIFLLARSTCAEIVPVFTRPVWL